MPPIPICTVDVGGDEGDDVAGDGSLDVGGRFTCRVGSGSVCSTIAFTRLTWMKESPRIRGIFSLTWTITILAIWQAAFEARVSTPKLRNPCSSGGEVMHHRHIEGNDAVAKEPRDLVQEDRHVVRPAVIDRLPVGRADKQRVMPEVARHVLRRQRVLPEQQHMVQLYVLQLLAALGQGA